MSKLEELIKVFDFKRDSGECFAHECFSPSTKTVILRENDLKSLDSKEVAQIEICDDHFNLLDHVLRKMNTEVYGNLKMIEFEIQDKLK